MKYNKVKEIVHKIEEYEYELAKLHEKYMSIDYITKADLVISNSAIDIDDIPIELFKMLLHNEFESKMDQLEIEMNRLKEELNE